MGDTPFKRYLAAKKKNEVVREYIRTNGQLLNVVYCPVYGLIPINKSITQLTKGIELMFILNKNRN